MNKSFTLIEILVVIVIIGVLSAFVLVGMSSITTSANITKSKAFSDSLRNSLLINLVSEWKLDGNTNDSWGNNNGTWSGPAGSNTTANWRLESECVSNGCLAFDGTDDYVEVIGSDVSTSNLAITGAITLGGWVKMNDLSLYNVGLFSRGRGAGINANYGYSVSWQDATPNTKIYFDTYSTTTRDSLYTVANPIKDNNWHYVIATWDGTMNTNGKKIYLDGILIKEKTSTIGSLGTPNYNFRIGKDYYLGFLNGSIDNALIYNNVLSISQIKQNYFIGVNKLFKNRRIAFNDFNERIIKLKPNLTSNE
ncbi:MAG TPA: LamG domain-containing protein [Candidatus Pacearchaeota archaeon]|nr:LamG domain-containing protein [Candidatus Pacearchaeota archaeon]HQM24305.1 LamG domain-containing protein [Candidatus Pacearchaeota archaeon]